MNIFERMDVVLNEGYWHVKGNVSANEAEYISLDRALSIADELDAQGWQERAAQMRMAAETARRFQSYAAMSPTEAAVECLRLRRNFENALQSGDDAEIKRALNALAAFVEPAIRGIVRQLRRFTTKVASFQARRSEHRHGTCRALLHAQGPACRVRLPAELRPRPRSLHFSDLDAWINGYALIFARGQKRVCKNRRRVRGAVSALRPGVSQVAMSHREGTHQGYRHAVRGPYARISSQSRAARQGKWEQREIIADYVRARETAPSSHNRELAVDFSRGECLT